MPSPTKDRMTELLDELVAAARSIELPGYGIESEPRRARLRACRAALLALLPSLHEKPDRSDRRCCLRAGHAGQHVFVSSERPAALLGECPTTIAARLLPASQPAANDYACPECDADRVLADRRDEVGICARCGWFGALQNDVPPETKRKQSDYPVDPFLDTDENGISNSEVEG